MIPVSNFKEEIMH